MPFHRKREFVNGQFTLPDNTVDQIFGGRAEIKFEKVIGKYKTVVMAIEFIYKMHDVFIDKNAFALFER